MDNYNPIVPIKFDTTKSYLTDDKKYLKIIAEIIIEYYKNKYSLDIVDIKFSDRHSVKSIKSLKGGLKHFMNIQIDDYDFNEIGMNIIGVHDFLKILYNPNDYLLYYFIFKILHELGHVNLNKYIYDLCVEYNLVYGNIYSLKSSVANIVDMLLPVQNNSTVDIFKYSYQPNEAQANIFAYQHFHETILLLREKGLLI